VARAEADILQAQAKLKQAGKHFLLVVQDVHSMAELLRFLRRMSDFVRGEEKIPEKLATT